MSSTFLDTINIFSYVIVSYGLLSVSFWVSSPSFSFINVIMLLRYNVVCALIVRVYDHVKFVLVKVLSIMPQTRQLKLLEKQLAHCPYTHIFTS